jgi:hypothetical protein
MRGGPLAMLVLLLAGWSGARAMLWENPFAPHPAAMFAVSDAAPGQPGISGELQSAWPQPPLAAPVTVLDPPALASLPGTAPAPSLALSFAAASLPGVLRRVRPGSQLRTDPRLAAAHDLLWFAALREPLRRDPAAAMPGDPGAALWSAAAPVLPLPPARRAQPGAPAAAAAQGRWSLDAWAFWRQGSDAAPISQGRVPIYGASQTGAVLQFRLAPGNRRDPRLYARAYRALVRRGEQEAALGASLRPVARLPLRLAGELRYTDGAFSSDLRPAAYAVTELAPVALPMGTRLEAYAQAGWVGGPGATAFADGQASVTRDLARITELTDNAVRFSFGAAAWGGAQRDAERLDIGPTLRFDVTVGAVPARVSVDWRERVAGNAGPDSGLAATLSTQF